MNLPELGAYTAQELTRACELSSALQFYLDPKSIFGEFARRRHQAWVQAALATVLGRADPESITRFWSEQADALLREAWTLAGFGDLEAVLLALGKLGAEELNLSSDVDLILVAHPKDVEAATAKLRRFRQSLDGGTVHGQVLRLDFDLRPGGRFGPLVTTPNQMRDYYWSQGETWERLAWVRARVVAGSLPLAAEIFTEMTPFSYRRFLDFTVMEELKLLRSRIQNSLILPADHLHLKLGRGAIRDVELFVHSLQIIHGGRRPELRTPSTTQALERLETHGVLPSADAKALLSSYWKLRDFENRVQATGDQQTHTLALNESHPLISDLEKQTALQICAAMDQLVSTLLGPVHADEVFWPEDPAAQTVWLAQYGVTGATAAEVWPQLQSATALSTKTERDERARREFLVLYLRYLRAHGLDQDLGLRTLLDFVRSIRAKASFFSLLLRSPNLVRDLVHLFSVSPYLGQLISSHPELLDSFLSQRQSSLSGDWDQWLEELTERRSLAELMAASHFLNSRNCARFGKELSETADQICLTLLERSRAEAPGSTVQILTLGKWGGLELGVRSDLDFVFVVNEEPTPADHRLARRMISRLTQTNRAGRLYPVDLRLRPSGQSGPLLTARSRLINYLKDEAKPWERQAYLRARWLEPGQAALGPHLLSRPLSPEDQVELRQIREKLLKPLQSQVIDLKLNPGGLVNIEFAAQLTVLRHQISPVHSGTLATIETLTQAVPLWAELGPQIAKSYDWLRLVEQLHQLTSFHSGSVVQGASPELVRLARLLKMEPPELMELVASRMQEVATWLDELDPLQ